MAVRILIAVGVCAFVLACVPLATSAADTASVATPALAEPSLSPDHAEIAFVSGGDIWSVPSSGGTARLLAAVGGAAKRPLFAPDGKRLAFVSTQAGSNGIYVLTLDGGALQRLTHDDQTPDLSAWSADGRYLYFSSNSHNIAYDADVYRVPSTGGTPMKIVAESYVNGTSAAPSPDGYSIAYVRGGFPQWWRRGHSHMDQTELVIAQPAAKKFDTVTNGDSKDQWPMWAPDGRSLYFVSDRSGSDELWTRGADGRTKQLTALKSGRVLWPSMSHDGRLIAFERNMRIWTYETNSGTPHELSIALRGLPDVVLQRHVTQTNQFSGLALAPDGKKLAFVARGRIFAASAQEGGEAQLVTTRNDAAFDLPAWAAGSRRLAYVVDRGREQAIAIADLPDGAQRILTPAGHHDDYPRWAPDGKSFAYVRDGRELHVFDVAANADRIAARGELPRLPFGDINEIAFSPAGDWIAYTTGEPSGFTNVFVVRASGGEARAVSFLANRNVGSIAWSPDGTRLFFVTGQRTESTKIAQIDLQPRTPRFREDAFRKLFPEDLVRPELPSRPNPAPAVSAPAPAVPITGSPAPSGSPAAQRLQIEFNGIRERASFVPTGLDATRVAVTPDSKTLVIVGSASNQEQLYTFPVDETSDDPHVAKQLTSTPSRKSSVTITPDGKSVYYLDGGRAFSADITGKGVKPVALTAEFDVDFARDKRVVFDQAWSLLDRWYADPAFHGADWNALHGQYEPFAVGARTPQEFYRVMSLMIGELNSSHTGISPPRTPGVPPYTVGRLGLDWDADAYERTGKLRVAAVVPLGPAAVAGRVAAGDELLAVNGTPVNRTTDLDELLANRIGKRTTLSVAPRGDAAAARTVVVLPMDGSDEARLRYLAWVATRRAYVERASGGRLGYVHIADMGTGSLEKLYADLDVQNREKSGVVVDVRNNTGGFTDPYVVDVLTRREYLTFKSRFGSNAPERSSLGQRVLGLPSVLVTNEHSLSDAENFSEAYRQLRAGPIVGEPTAGWIIFTGGSGLADGGTVRLPVIRVIAHDGVDMEMHPRPVDVRVANPAGAAERGQDPQLDAAVRELLKRVGKPQRTK